MTTVVMVPSPFMSGEPLAVVRALALALDLAELEALRVGLVIVERDKWWTPTALRDC